MRFWHYRLIDVLPNKHLVAQFRECVAVYSMLKNTGKTNNCIVRASENYPLEETKLYCSLVAKEMNNRKFRTSSVPLSRMDLTKEDILSMNTKPEDVVIFNNWHNDRYLRQCYYMMQERLDVGMITLEEFEKIENRVKSIINI